jgi:type VI secretion system secreted protein VgrG
LGSDVFETDAYVERMRVSLIVQGSDALSARSFSISESMSAPFDASIVAMSREDDLDLDGLIGAPATLAIGEPGGERVFAGVIAEAEQVHAESTGLSTYSIRIVPKIALLAHRSQSKVFQRQSVPEIVTKVLTSFGIQVRSELDKSAYPEHEYRVQHGESDLDFVNRLLEEAGIAWSLEPSRDHGSIVVLTDRAQHAEPKLTLRYLDNPGPDAAGVYVTALALRRVIGPGGHVIHDHDFKKHKGVALTGSAGAAGAESGLTRTHHHQGAIVRHGEHRADHLAQVALEGDRAHLKIASFRTTSLMLSPGTVFRVADHPRQDLAVDKPLLALENVIEGTASGSFTIFGKAAPTSVAHRPARKTPRPHVSGVESGVVVGPKGESIHTDEHGRVRVQLAWDREQGFDEKSSCWVRVSQAWAGSGFGMMALPRVGQEVLVGFLGGDPDQPVVVGRVFNAENTTPWKLPENRTKTGLRTASVPSVAGDDAYNEIAFEDKKGHELVTIQAEKDLELVVKGNENERIGQNLTNTVGKNRNTTVAGVDSTLVGATHTVAITAPGGASSTRLEMSDRKIVCTTGEATVTFDGPDLALEAQGNVTIVAHDGDVIIKGGPNVKINC